jgi:hypothetical protein
MCCAFNRDNAETIFKKSKYTKVIKELEKFEEMRNFEPNGKIPYKTKLISQAGSKMGLTVTLDAHSDLLTEFSVLSDFQGFVAMVMPKTDFPLTFQQGFDVTPGMSIK